LITAARHVGRYGNRDAAMILLMFRHGYRTAELIALKWSHVDLREGYVNGTDMLSESYLSVCETTAQNDSGC